MSRSKRSLSLKEQIALMSVRGKITIVVLCVALVAFIFTCTYISLAKEDEELQANVELENEAQDEEEIDTSYIEFVDEIIDDNTVTNEVTNTVSNTVKENTVQKEVTYKGKTVEVPKAEVAKANSAEDSQKKKTGGETISAEQAATKFENDGQSSGIDVSAHQGKIDWAQVKNSGIEFAMIRCGFRGRTEGAIYEDAYFKTNIRNAVNNGVKVGIYFYSTAISEEEALQEAAWVVETIKSYRITYPVVYDFEDFGAYRCAGLSGEQATTNAITFLNYVSSKGYTPMMYANKTDISSHFNRGRLSGYKFWLAHYTSATNYTGSYQMWQYTSAGKVPGISGNVDMNVAYFRYGAVAEPKHTHNFENGAIIKTPESKEPTCLEPGVRFRRCTDCSESQREEVPALNGEHKFGEYTVTKAPTETLEGEKTRECTICHTKETAKIEKLKPVSNNTTNTNTNTNSNTDTQNTVANNTATNNTTVNNTTNTDSSTENNNVDDATTNDTVPENTVQDNSANENITKPNEQTPSVPEPDENTEKAQNSIDKDAEVI